MDNMKVKDVMIAAADYATISAEATLGEAQIALATAEDKYNQTQHSYRALLVLDGQGRVSGKVSILDILKGLEPKYKELGDFGLLSRFGFSHKFYDFMMKDIDILQKPLDHICEKASQIRVKEIMQVPSKGAYIDQKASLNKAIHQLVVEHHQSLMVTHNNNIVGILRLVDVFDEIGRRMNTCHQY